MSTSKVLPAREHMSRLFEGYFLTESELDSIVDEGVDFVIFLDENRGRFVSVVDDWLDRSINDPVFPYRHLRQSVMTRG